MCDHNTNIEKTYLSILYPAGEVYMCKCGALVDFKAPENYHNPVYPMSASELTDVIAELLDSEAEKR